METVKAGVKRKRYEPPQEDVSVRIGGKIHHEKKDVHRASKRAKVFETQKVVKRLKDLRKKNEDSKGIEALEAELDSLKGVDHDAIGNSAFRSKVHKDHALRDNEDVKAAMTKELDGNLCDLAEPGTALSKIQSRLLSSKILATQVAASVESLKFLLNPALRRHKPADIADSNAFPLRHPSKAQRDTHSTASPIQAAKPSGELENDEVGWESGSVEEAGSDDGWESGSIDGDIPGDRGQSTSSEDDESEDEAALDQESVLDASVREETAKRATKGKQQKLTSTKSGKATSMAESTFLPSLSVGFVRGSDDSNWSETEGKAADMSRKNRRGQRARRAIWEKKFGRNANHKKKEAEERAVALSRKAQGHTSSINTGSNAIYSTRTPPGHGPPGATGPNTQRKSLPQRQQPVDRGWGGRFMDASSTSHAHKSSRVKDGKDDKPLHPSWEAKRKLKEKESVGIVPSQGKKIKFS